MNSKIKIGSMFLLTAVLVVGTISVSNIPKSFAAPGADIQTIKCVNSNVNINGVDVNKHNRGLSGNEASAEDAQQIDREKGQGNGLFGGLNIDRNLVNICVNVNLNEQIDPIDSGEEPVSEICNNGQDDDGDGEIDEPDCIIFESLSSDE